MHHQMHRGGPWHDGRVQHQVSHEQILERVHQNLYSVVGEAVDEVKHDEMKWSQSEMVKRIVNYIYKGCKDPDLMSKNCLLYTSPSPRDRTRSRMPSSA